MTPNDINRIKGRLNEIESCFLVELKSLCMLRMMGSRPMLNPVIIYIQETGTSRQ